MSSTEKLLKVYINLFQHKDLLGETGALFTLDPATLGQDGLTHENLQLVEKVTTYTVSYLLSGVNVTAISRKELIDRIIKGYENQEFWYFLLLDYADFLITRDKEELVHDEKQVFDEGKEILKQILQAEHNEKAIIKTFSEKINEAGFHVNAEKLVANYLKMRRNDAKMAWQVLTENPAFFSPIITKDSMGSVILKKEDAIEENKRLAKFLKKLKV